MLRIYLSLAVVVIASLVFWRYQYVSDQVDKKQDQVDDLNSQLSAKNIEINQLQRQAEQLAKYHETKEQVVYVDKIVTKDVVKYRERVVNRCELNNDWVRIHNAATKNTMPEASERTHEANAVVDDARALEVVTENYRACIGAMNQCAALQEWAIGVAIK